MRTLGGTLAVLVVLVAAALAAGQVAGAETACAADGERQLCLADVSLSTDRTTAGESATLEVTVENEGEDAANASVVLNTVDPENDTESYTLREERIDPGEELTVSQRLDASTVGPHGLQVLVFDGSIDHQYDASEVRTLEVEPKSDGLGGSVDRAEFALAALLGSLTVLGVIAYRNN